MMEQDDLLKDDYLKMLIGQIPEDAPSGDFTDRVMATIRAAEAPVAEKRPFYFYLKTVAPYLAVALLVFVVVSTSDLPLFNWLPGKTYLMNNLAPYLGTLFATLKTAFSTKFVSWVVMISFSAGMLFLVDRFFSRRTAA